MASVGWLKKRLVISNNQNAASAAIILRIAAHTQGVLNDIQRIRSVLRWRITGLRHSTAAPQQPVRRPLYGPDQQYLGISQDDHAYAKNPGGNSPETHRYEGTQEEAVFNPITPVTEAESDYDVFGDVDTCSSLRR
jgi:hypothetical protein